MAPRGLPGGWPAAPGSPSRSGRTPCGTHSSPRRWTPGFRSATSRKPPRMPIRAPRCAMTVPAAVSTDMPPTSSPPTLPEPPGKHLTAHMQAPPDRTQPSGGARQCRQQEPRLVTDRDPKRDHEPPIWTDIGWMQIRTLLAHIWMFGATALTFPEAAVAIWLTCTADLAAPVAVSGRGGDRCVHVPDHAVSACRRVPAESPNVRGRKGDRIA